MNRRQRGRAGPTLKTRRGDSGLASIELAILLPGFVLLILLAAYLGRQNVVRTSIDSAAQDAARAASEQRTYNDAQNAATAAARAALDAPGSLCLSGTVTATVQKPPDPFAVPAGTASTVFVTVICQVNFGDLAFPGLPVPTGNQTLTSTFSSPIDTYRFRSQT
jgi:Flp pilus assembly protein TadG